MYQFFFEKTQKKSPSARKKIPDNLNEANGIRTFWDPLQRGEGPPPTLMVYAKRVSGYPVPGRPSRFMGPEADYGVP